MFPRIIAICGKKRAGKDCIASILCRDFGYTTIKIADTLKLMVRLLFGFTEDQTDSSLKDDIDENWGISPRQSMQFFGTEVMQFKLQELLPNMGRNYFIQSLIARYIEKFPDKKYVISDVRFLHEYAALHIYDPYFIRVERDTCIDDTCCHMSETEFLNIPVNIIINNNGSLHELEQKIHNIMHVPILDYHIQPKQNDFLFV